MVGMEGSGQVGKKIGRRGSEQVGRKVDKQGGNEIGIEGRIQGKEQGRQVREKEGRQGRRRSIGNVVKGRGKENNDERLTYKEGKGIYGIEGLERGFLPLHIYLSLKLDSFSQINFPFSFNAL